MRGKREGSVLESSFPICQKSSFANRTGSINGQENLKYHPTEINSDREEGGSSTGKKERPNRLVKKVPRRQQRSMVEFDREP